MSGTVGATSVAVYDHKHGWHVSGSGGPSYYSLYHHGESSHISLDINEDGFRGFITELVTLQSNCEREFHIDIRSRRGWALQLLNLTKIVLYARL